VRSRAAWHGYPTPVLARYGRPLLRVGSEAEQRIRRTSLRFRPHTDTDYAARRPGRLACLTMRERDASGLSLRGWGQAVLVGAMLAEGLLDALGGGGSDALVDREGLP
jgi:hypothetical protein